MLKYSNLLLHHTVVMLLHPCTMYYNSVSALRKRQHRSLGELQCLANALIYTRGSISTFAIVVMSPSLPNTLLHTRWLLKTGTRRFWDNAKVAERGSSSAQAPSRAWTQSVFTIVVSVSVSVSFVVHVVLLGSGDTVEMERNTGKFRTSRISSTGIGRFHWCYRCRSPKI